MWDTRSVVEIKGPSVALDLVLRVGRGAEPSEWHGLCDRRERLRLSGSELMRVPEEFATLDGHPRGRSRQKRRREERG